jgi:hypothetical protein
MAKGLPHSSEIHANLKSYLQDAEKLSSNLVATISQEPEFTGVFRNAIAAYSVLTKFSRGNQVSLLTTAASVVRRCPYLLAFGQISLARIELRRFLESVSRYPYFYEHPVEWQRVLSDPEVGTLKDDSDPIGWCAARDQKWYVNYIRVRFPDKSGLISSSLEVYNRLYRDMSSHVHVTKESAVKFRIADVVEEPAPTELRKFRESQRMVYAAGLITSLAVKPSMLNKLTAVERSWLDWLLGSANSKAIAGGSFLSW